MEYSELPIEQFSEVHGVFSLTHKKLNFFLFFLLLNSVYTVLPLSQCLDRVKGGTIHMKTVKYVHTKLCLSVYTEYY